MEESDLKLEVEPETPVQLQFGIDSTVRRYSTKIIGYADKQSIIMHTPQIDKKPIILREDQVVTVRFMGTNNAYAFVSSVKAVYLKPFPHIHIAYPTEIKSSLVRKAERVHTNFDATLVNLNSESTTEVDARILNISASGALISIPGKAFGKISDELKITIRVVFNDTEKSISIIGIIRSLRDEVQDELSQTLHGVQFKTNSFDKHLMLQGMIYNLLHSA